MRTIDSVFIPKNCLFPLVQNQSICVFIFESPYLVTWIKLSLSFRVDSTVNRYTVPDATVRQRSSRSFCSEIRLAFLRLGSDSLPRFHPTNVTVYNAKPPTPQDDYLFLFLWIVEDQEPRPQWKCERMSSPHALLFCFCHHPS